LLYLLTTFLPTHHATTVIHTLSLHDALPISRTNFANSEFPRWCWKRTRRSAGCRRHLIIKAIILISAATASSPRLRRLTKSGEKDRKSTRLNSSHQIISYAVFCLKKKNKYME